MRYCEREDFKEARKASKLCSKHSSKEQFAVDLEFLAQYGYENAHARLKPDAVPIRKTCPCNVYPLKPPHLYRKTGVCRGISIGRVYLQSTGSSQKTLKWLLPVNCQ